MYPTRAGFFHKKCISETSDILLFFRWGSATFASIMDYHANQTTRDWDSTHPFTDGYTFELQRPMLSNCSEKVAHGKGGGEGHRQQKTEAMTSPSKVPTWRKVGYEFTQSTTLHGVNKITEPTPFPSRRWDKQPNKMSDANSMPERCWPT